MGRRGAFPGGLPTLCASIAFERGAYYGLQSILALYLADLLAERGGAGLPFLLAEFAGLTNTSGVALAAVVTGLFFSLATLAPVIGGLIADRLIGQHRAILAGGMLMAAGHGLLAVEELLLVALAAIALGSGFFKGAVAARLSGLYAQDDPRRVEGFRLFYLAINIAGLIAPLVIGTVGERASWHAGFALSCGAMLAGLAIYWRGFRAAGAAGEGAASLAMPAAATAPRTGLAALVGLGAGTALLVVPNAQLPNAYLLWASEGFLRELAGWRVPVSWLIAADGLVSLAALAGSGVFWARIEARRGAVSAEAKSLIGAVFVIAGAACLALAALVHGRSNVPILWGIAFQVLNSIGLANVLPAVMARFGQSSAPHSRATVMAGFYLALFAGGLASTGLASRFAELDIAAFWLVHVACAVAGTALLALLRREARPAALAVAVE